MLAVVSGKSPEEISGPRHFFVELCESVEHFPSEDGTKRWQNSKDGLAIGHRVFPVLRGQHRGWVSIKPMFPDWTVKIIVDPSQAENAVLGLWYKNGRDSKKKAELEIPIHTFLDEGFDLDHRNHDNYGKVLSSTLAQLLFNWVKESLSEEGEKE